MLKKELSNQIISKIFKDPDVQYGLKEFKGIKLGDVLDIFEVEEGKYYIKDPVRAKDILVYNEEKNLSKPEEIIRQLWLHKIIKDYGYPIDRIGIEKDIHFGREIHGKAADIVIYQKDKETPWVIIELKSPDEKKGLEQLKSYVNSEGAPIGVWSNGNERVILYRSHPHEFENTLRDIPRADQSIEDVLTEDVTLSDLESEFDLVDIIKILEELVLANSGVDSFNEIFKLIYAKLFDEKEAKKREKKILYFRQYKDPELTMAQVSKLFDSARKEWPGIFNDYEKIELSPNHLDVCVGQLEKIKLYDANLEVIDSAFEYLLPDVAKGKKGQYFTPRHVINMAVKMLSPQPNEYVIDPACGSGGFLIHAMRYVYDNYLHMDREAMSDYAKKYLFGIDFDDKSVKISRALMLIAGDGKTHIFKLNSLNPRDWMGNEAEKERARGELRNLLHKFDDYDKNKDNQENFRFFDYDILLSNPPFAGEIIEKTLLNQYELSKNEAGKLKNKMERHILFIERSVQLVKPGGRLAIVLPQGVFNNTNMQHVRQFLMDKARILAVVGLNVNTFKPHTGTKTSVLFLQKFKEKEKAPKDYNIFMAVSQKSGKDNSGDYVYKKDAEGKLAVDMKGKKVLDHDLDEIAEEFLKFAKKENLNF
ncbi:MAG: N-6 DNA methylase [Candidatus Parcubacteria bacterium]|nr:N-6 DNA methylase [Candidatus Parcubacteria bacterium]